MKIKKQFRNKRSATDIKRDRKAIRHMLKTKLSERAIPNVLNMRFDCDDVEYTLSRSQVHLDIVAVKSEKKKR